jgi:hypothetical protein
VDDGVFGVVGRVVQSLGLSSGLSSGISSEWAAPIRAASAASVSSVSSAAKALSPGSAGQWASAPGPSAGGVTSLASISIQPSSTAMPALSGVIPMSITWRTPCSRNSFCTPLMVIPCSWSKVLIPLSKAMSSGR